MVCLWHCPYGVLVSRYLANRATATGTIPHLGDPQPTGKPRLGLRESHSRPYSPLKFLLTLGQILRLLYMDMRRTLLAVRSDQLTE